MRFSEVTARIYRDMLILHDGVPGSNGGIIQIPEKDSLLQELSDLLDHPLESPEKTNWACTAIIEKIKDRGLRMAVDAMAA